MKHFNTRVSNWEVWNEENLEGFWGGGSNNPAQSPPSVQAYAALLEAVYPVIHKEQPTATVILGGMGDAAGSNNIRSQDFLKGVYAAGAGASFDAVAAHVYGDAVHNTTEFIDQLPVYRQVMDDHGDYHKKLWVTEAGDQVGPGLATQAQQAAMVKTTWNTLHSLHDAGPMFNYTLDDTNEGSTETGYGMLDSQGKPRLVVTALQNLAKATPSPVVKETPALALRQPLLWVHTQGSDPTDAQVETVAGHYHTVVLSASMTSLALRLQALDPALQILASVDLAQVKQAEAATPVTTGVSYNDAQKNNWLARDSSGNLIPWNDSPGSYQAAVEDPGYQAAWTSHALATLAAGPWDGILANNDERSLGWHTPALLAGTTTEAATEYKLQDGLRQLVEQAGLAVQAQGKTFISNVEEARLRPGDWLRDASHGGALDAMWTSWAQEGTPTITDNSLMPLVQNMVSNSHEQSLAQAPYKGGDSRSALYGYASFLLGYKPGDAWGGNDGSLLPTLPKEASLSLGAPLTGLAQDVNGELSRSFLHGWVLVNPSSTQSLAHTVPQGAKYADGTTAPSVITLAPASAVVLSTN